MSFSLLIHRASHEIGGNAIEITHHTTRILLDVGLPLSSFESTLPPAHYRPNIRGLFKEENPSFSAVFLTHAHLDHTGLLCEINPTIPVYASPATIALLKNVTVLLGAPSVAHLKFIPITNGQTVKIGSLQVTARAVDHSAAQSLAYEVTAERKKLVYTGDLRLHGTCSYLTYRFMHQTLSPDVLLLEGTTLNRPAGATLTEKGLQNRLSLLLQKIPHDVLPLIYFSAQNLDRFISVYKTARALHKTLVIDPYTCYTLEQLKAVSTSVVQYNWRNIRVYFAPNRLTRALKETLKKYAAKKIDLQTILRTPDKFIVKDNTYIRRQLLAHTNRLHFIHSAWEGYLKKENSLLQQDMQKYGITLTQLHTSGHADERALRTLVRVIHPKRIVPVHTDVPTRYKEVFSVPVHLLKDGERLTL